MHIKALILTLVAGLASPAFSQDSVQPLRQALDHLPQVVGTSPAPIQAYFFDVQGWGYAGSKQIPRAALTSLFFARSIEPLRQLSFQASDVWAEKSGIAFKDITYFAGFGQVPQTVSYWGLREEAGARHLMETLKKREFVDVPGPVTGVYGNGNPQHRMNPAKSDPFNPWRGGTGKIYFVKQLDNVIVQSPALKAMAVLSKTKPSLAENAVVSAALDGLSGTIGVDEGRIIQAAVISPAFGLSATDPTKHLMQKPHDAKRMIEEKVRKGQVGVPHYLGGILADVRQKDRPGLVVSLVYPDCSTADKAIKSITARWAESPAKDFKADVSTSSVENSGKLCVAIVTLTGHKTEKTANPVLGYVMEHYLRRDFNLLQIGAQR